VPRQNKSTTVQTSQKAKKFLNIAQAAHEFIQAANQRENDAIKIATDVSRSTFKSHLSGRPLVPQRPGRRTTSGAFASYIQWQRAPQARDISISLDSKLLKSVGPYAFINEIGTGKTAVILNPPGSISIPSQVGRNLPRGLVWATHAGGTASGPATGVGHENLFLRSDINGGFVAKGRVGRIRREIKGKHFIQQGGVQGFRALDVGLRADAKRIFQ
jgi:hypothetical protein